MVIPQTALLMVLDGAYTAADNRKVTVLVGFDTVDHAILPQQLQFEFGVTHTPLSYIIACHRFTESLFTNRHLLTYYQGFTPTKQGGRFVKLGQHQSHVIGLDVAVSLGSVLGPLLFAIYCNPVAHVIASSRLQYRQ